MEPTCNPARTTARKNTAARMDADVWTGVAIAAGLKACGIRNDWAVDQAR
jgi:hypothetical protein